MLREGGECRGRGAEGPRGQGVKNNETEISEELLNFEQRIDKIALMAFDIYMECREKIYEIKIKEFKQRAGDYGK